MISCNQAFSAVHEKELELNNYYLPFSWLKSELEYITDTVNFIPNFPFSHSWFRPNTVKETKPNPVKKENLHFLASPVVTSVI